MYSSPSERPTIRQSGHASPPRCPGLRAPSAMYVVEISLRLSPMPVAVQRKELEAALSLYGEVRQAL